jgi:hypothetical protein
VLGDVLLGRGERVLQLADGRVAVAQAVEQLDAHRLAEHAEALRDQLHERLRERVGDRGHRVHIGDTIAQL